jgi:hypothetical protein
MFKLYDTRWGKTYQSQCLAIGRFDLSDLRKLDGDELTSRGVFGRLGRPDGDDRVQLAGPYAIDKTGCKCNESML